MNPELRLTIIDWQGRAFDNLMEATGESPAATRNQANHRPWSGNAYPSLQKHKYRLPLLRKSMKGYFIRFAMPYDLQVKNFIHAHSSFIYYILIFFVLCMLMVYFCQSLLKSLKELRAFSLSVKRERRCPPARFSDEVGQVSADIINYPYSGEPQEAGRRA